VVGLTGGFFFFLFFLAFRRALPYQAIVTPVAVFWVMDTFGDDGDCSPAALNFSDFFLFLPFPNRTLREQTVMPDRARFLPDRSRR